jgi:hypothetical protein
MAISFTGTHFPQDIMLMSIRWYVAYPLSTRHVEELMLERGVHGDHSNINRWVVKYSPQLEEAFHRRKRPVWVSWRMDETYIKGHCQLNGKSLLDTFPARQYDGVQMTKIQRFVQEHNQTKPARGTARVSPRSRLRAGDRVAHHMAGRLRCPTRVTGTVQA